jgi:hypothetical protein
MNCDSVLSRLVRGGVWSILAASLLPPLTARSQEIIINEVMASNQSTAPLADYTDYYPDFIELYNNSGREIDLVAEQWAISTKSNPEWGPLYFDFKDFFYFPPGTPPLPADSYLLIFLDGDTNFPGLHTTFTKNGTNVTFTLSRTGDSVKLYKNLAPAPRPTEPVPIDAITFGFQLPTNSIGRVPDFTGPFTLTVPTPCGGTIPCLSNIAAPFVSAPASSNEFTLKINEWLAFNTSGGKTNDDWFEIYNPDTNIVSMSGLVFVDRGYTDVDLNKPENQIPQLSFIGPQGFVKITADDDENDQNSDPADADVVDFSLSSTSAQGDIIHMFAADRATLIDKVILPTFPVANVSRGRVPDGGDIFAGRLPNLSPEASNFGTIPEVAINEVLTHTDPPLEDAIELVNNTDSPQNVNGWWLTNQRNNPKKFQIRSGTDNPTGIDKSVIPPRGFVVFYESEFNNPARAAQPFTLNSANGDECYLYKADTSGKLLGFRRGIDFGPAENGVSFGRYITSETNVDIVALADLSLGSPVRATDPPSGSYQVIFRSGRGETNPTPKIGPVVVNEIHFAPRPIGFSTNDNTIDEYIELYNVSDSTVLFYDNRVYRADATYNPAPDGTVVLAGQVYADGRTNTWRLRGGADFNFPEDVSLGAGQFLLVVNFDPSSPGALAAFTNRVGAIPPGTQVFGPFRGADKLRNGGDTVELLKADIPQGPQRLDFRLVPYVRVDKIDYNDDPPWPDARANGSSLQRQSSYDYGNDPINWMAAAPNPGRYNTPTGIQPPSIATQPQSRTVTAGSDVTFRVSARGGQLHYQWMSNDVPVAAQNSATLVLQNVNTNQSAGYYVIVTNIAGAVTSSVAVLTVNASKPDSKPPTALIKTPTLPVLTNEVIVVTGSALDNIGVNGVFYSVNGGTYLPASADNANWSSWRTPILSLLPGTNVVRAYSVDQAGNQSATNARSYLLSVKVPLGLSTNGLGSVTGATNGQLLEIGRNFTLTATPAAGQVFSNFIVFSNMVPMRVSTAPVLTYMMVSNTSVEANFVPNPFARVAGKFNGLFYETNQSGGVLHGSSGFFTLTVTDRGTYTASLLGGGFKLSAAGQLDLNGRATNTIVRKGTNALVVTWHVDLGGSDEITGAVSDPVAGWTATIEGDRATFSKTSNPCPLAGKYTLLLPGLPHDAFVPGGHSYGTVSIDSNGVATLKGYLADKTSAAQKVPLSKDGQWPLYVPLYSGKGSLLSWIGFADGPTNDFHGLLNWSKPMLPTAKHYPGGFTTNEAEVVGSRYVAPAGVTGKILQMSDGRLSFTGGNLAEDAILSATLGLGSKVTNNSAPAKLTMTFTVSSGLFKGSYTPTNAGAKAVSFAGAVLQKATNAAGYYLGTNQSGRVLLEAAP